MLGLERVRRRALRRLRLERLLDLEQRLTLLLGDRREARVDVHQRVRQHSPHTDPPEPLPISRNHVPRRPLRTRMRQHFGERLLVVIPALPLADVGGRELPVVIREVDAPQEPGALLLLGDVQEQLDDPKPVIGQIALPIVDLAVAALPHIPLLRRARKLLTIEILGVHPHHEHLLVVRPVEDPDVATRRQPLRIAPQEVVIKLLRRRDLEAVDVDTLRIHAAHHMTNRPVLARRIQRLQHDQHAPRVLRRQPRLVLGQQPHAVLEQRDPILLLLHAGLEPRIKIPTELDLRTRLHAERRDELRHPLLPLISHRCLLALQSQTIA